MALRPWQITWTNFFLNDDKHYNIKHQFRILTTNSLSLTFNASIVHHFIFMNFWSVNQWSLIIDQSPRNEKIRNEEITGMRKWNRGIEDWGKLEACEGGIVGRRWRRKTAPMEEKDGMAPTPMEEKDGDGGFVGRRCLAGCLDCRLPISRSSDSDVCFAWTPVSRLLRRTFFWASSKCGPCACA